jgi:pyridoxamine 5'-phosphate oxidase
MNQIESKTMNIADLRRDYSHATLSEHDADPDPIKQFSKWFEEALAAKMPEPNAMSVATVGSNGRPSSRILLLKDVDARGFSWFTNYTSRKAQDLEHNPFAALTFHWVELERQVRIEGKVERVPAAESDAYFGIRPLKSRLGAHASDQSKTIDSREHLEKKFDDAEHQFGDNPPRPLHWGGYRLTPEVIEFWQGRSSRLHDRVLYTRAADGNWQRQRLQP